MDTPDASRRALLQAIAAVVATAATAASPFAWTGEPAFSFLRPGEAADVEAVTARIVPSGDSPGAREAGAVYFIDRALATFFSQLAADYRTFLEGFQAAYRQRHPDAASFASLTAEQQDEFLKSVEETPFFAATRTLTLIGMFSSPSHGGNRNGAGWALIGFEDHHIFQPPFGYYDRGYPGFTTDTEKEK
jgi:Gluconate 2-dehydrogenase subunit 3